MSDVRDVASRAVRAYAEHFGCDPLWVACAPGRVNLIGEHTDYNDGFVLPIAIDRWCVAAASPARGKDSRVRAHDLDADVRVSLAWAASRGAAARAQFPAWAQYAIGALVEHSPAIGLDRPPEVDLLLTSTVPLGGGLSSSAALETAVAVALESAAGVPADPFARATSCQRAEHAWAGVPCGLMDQLASSCGVADHALLIDCRARTLTPVRLPPEEDASVLVVNSGVHHRLAAGEYAKRRAVCEGAAHRLGVRSLRDIAAPSGLDWDLLDEEQRRCVRHVVGENARVLAAVEALRDRDLGALGRLMLQSHASLRDDYRVSCRELDIIVDFAVGTPGVLGARMTGGGFGGCAVVLATPAGAAAFRERLPARYRDFAGISCTVEAVRAVDGARSMPGHRSGSSHLI